MARLDRLGPAREIAQIGSVIGREFGYELLHAVAVAQNESMLEASELQSALERLTDSELVYRRGMPSLAYVFKHTTCCCVAAERNCTLRLLELWKKASQGSWRASRNCSRTITVKRNEIQLILQKY